MVNLLSQTTPQALFPALDRERLDRLCARLPGLSVLSQPRTAAAIRRGLEALSPELEELESSPSLELAHDLIGRIDGLRRDAQGAGGQGREPASVAPLRGDWIFYRPGRSLQTGEADVASQGLFDVLDRPPLESWVEAVGRPIDADRTRFEVGVIAWIPEAALARARAGRTACRSGALAFSSDRGFPELAALGQQLAALIDGAPRP